VHSSIVLMLFVASSCHEIAGYDRPTACASCPDGGAGGIDVNSSDATTDQIIVVSDSSSDIAQRDVVAPDLWPPDLHLPADMVPDVAPQTLVVTPFFASPTLDHRWS
jgi:hypothetical protein